MLGSFQVYNLTSKFTIELPKPLFVIKKTRCCAAAPPSTVRTPAAPETGFVQGRLPPPSYHQGGDYIGDDEDDYGDDEDDYGDDGHCSRNRHINKVVIMVMLMLMLMATAPASFISIR